MTSTLTQIPTPFFTGLMTSAGLIIAIGAQNAFVLSQGIRRQHPWAIAGLCSLIDTLLIALGILGMGVLISSSEWLMHGVTWAGVAFLLTYGFRALQAAINPSTLNTDSSQLSSLSSALLTTLTLSLLNPHVYLDTVVLLGSIGGRYPEAERWWFGAGAAIFSLIWFFSLSLGARWLARWFHQPLAWRILDGAVCLMMWTLAAMLATGQLS